ncbi:MAG: ATP-binding protein [Polynucleobacter sp.]
MNKRLVYLLKGGENPLILGVGAILATIIIATAIISAFSIRENSTQEWTKQLDNLTLTLSAQVSQTLYSANTALDSIAQEVKTAKIEDERQFREFASKESQFVYLVQKTNSNPLINVAAYIDNKGEILNYSRSYPTPKINIADRDYFLNAQLATGEGTFYSVPIQNRTNQDWIFYLTRKLYNRNGEFLGLIVVGISSEVFSKFYASVGENLGKGSSISLYRDDFTVMTRWPFTENAVGQKRADSETMKMVKDLKLSNGVFQSSEANPLNNALGIGRMVAARVVKNYPFIVTAEVNEDVYLQSWYENEKWIWISAAASLMILALSIHLLLKANHKINAELAERIAAQKELTRAHERLEVRVKERTVELSREVSDRKLAQEELARLNTYIADVSHRAGMAEVANSVIHNVGNALNSINVAVTTINSEIKSTPLHTLPKIADMLKANEGDLSSFLNGDEKGKQLPKLIGMLSEQWKMENATLLSETKQLQESVAHIREIVSRQQSLSGKLGIDEIINVSDLINNCLSFYVTNFKNAQILVSMDNEPGLEWTGDRSKITQILLNLIMNAEESLISGSNNPKTLKITSFNNKNEGIQIEVSDNGTGIEPEVLNKLFGYGFTTKPFGHGLGLHASAIAANEMNGTLQAFSSGKDKGATFILTLPKQSSGTNV